MLLKLYVHKNCAALTQKIFLIAQNVSDMGTARLAPEFSTVYLLQHLQNHRSTNHPCPLDTRAI